MEWAVSFILDHDGPDGVEEGRRAAKVCPPTLAIHSAHPPEVHPQHPHQTRTGHTTPIALAD